MKAPSYASPPVDPLVTQAENTAQQQLASALQTQGRSDTASLMAQYGALAGAVGPSAAPSTAVTGGLSQAKA